MSNSTRLRFLTESEVSLMHDRCFKILTEKGIRVEYAKTLKLLEKAGAIVDWGSENVRFPTALIEQALKTAPKSFTVKGSHEEHDLTLPHPQGSFYTSTCVQSMKYHDYATNRFVDVTTGRMAEWNQLAEALPNIHKVAMQTPMDVPRETADIHGLKVQLENTAKPLMVLAYCPETVGYMFELMLAKAGSVEALRDRPMVLTYPTSLSPLKFKPMDMETILQSCHYGVPMAVNSLAISGATAPVTLAGTALLASVEILAMVVMAQIFKPGIPVVASIYTTTMDMATGNALLGNTESMLSRAAATQFLKESFNLPVETFSFMSDAYLSDGQAMVEKSLMPAMLDLAGSDIQYGCGRLGGPTSASPIQMIIDDRIFSIIEKCNSKIPVNEDTLAFEEILENAPDGEFVSTEHTLKYCRESIRPDLFVANTMDQWEAKGRKDLYERAVEKYKELKKDLHPQPLSEEVKREMAGVVKHADNSLVGKLGK